MSTEHPEQIPAVGHRAELPDAIAPDGSEIRLLIDQRHQARGASMVEVVLPPGGVSRPVWHQQVEEIWYILEGRGQVWRCPPDTDPNTMAPVSVGPGDALTIPTRWRFQFGANPEAALRFLCVTLPPWPGPEEAQPAEPGGLGPATV
ncbi:MAG: cupin domain-containing protein [Dehalococcoidia bacterium]